MACDGWTLEVTRLATDGTKNACSFLYGAARRAAFALGYSRLLTYTLAEENGSSLRASGFVEEAQIVGESWKRRGRPSVDDRNPIGDKTRWVAGHKTQAEPPHIDVTMDQPTAQLDFGETNKATVLSEAEDEAATRTIPALMESLHLGANHGSPGLLYACTSVAVESQAVP